MRSEIQPRDALARARLWLLVGLAWAGVAVLAIAGASTCKMTADVRLATEQSRTAALLSVGEIVACHRCRKLPLHDELLQRLVERVQTVPLAGYRPQVVLPVRR